MKKTTNEVLDIHNLVTADELYKIIAAQLDEISKNPDSVNIMAPCMIWGSPGIGKSSVVRQLCKDRNIEFIDCRLSQMEPCDVRGLPVPNRDNKCMDWFVNGMWPRDQNGRGIIFLDEISACDRSVSVAAYELILDRRLGKLYSVPPGYLIVAAGNKTTDRAVASTMSSALANRFMHVELGEDSESWLVWARMHDIHPAVTGFIQYRPNMLFNMEGENLERGWPSPRSWERVSQLCHMYSKDNEKILSKLVYGTVGNGAGVEFMEFYKINSEFDDILDIMTNPNADIVIPDRADRRYALCSAMVYLLWRGRDEHDENSRIEGFYRISLKLPSDFASMALIASFNVSDPVLRKTRSIKMMHHPMFMKWKEKHGASFKMSMKR